MKRVSKKIVYASAGIVCAALIGVAVFLLQPDNPETHIVDVPGDQQVQEASRHGATIITKLIPKKRVVLQSVELCPVDGLLSSQAADISRSCTNGVCMTLIDFQDQPIPAEITINRLYNHACMKQPFQTARFVQVIGYKGDIAVPQTLGAQLHLSDAVNWIPQKTEHSRFNSADAFGVTRSGKIALHYTAPVAEDEFLLGEKLIKVTYGEVVAASVK